MTVNFSGTHFINNKYLSANKVGGVLAGQDGTRIIVGDKNRPEVVVIDPKRNKNAYRLDGKLQSLAKEAADKHHIPMSQVLQTQLSVTLSDKDIKKQGDLLLSRDRSFAENVKHTLKQWFRR